MWKVFFIQSGVAKCNKIRSFFVSFIYKKLVMRKSLFTIIIVCCVKINFAQNIIIKDISIEKMVKEISPDSLRSYIQTMVNFGTRNTLSTQSAKSRGIGAARTYVLNKFNDFAMQSGGRMTAIIDTTTLQPDKRRVDTTLLLGNVVATLKGTDPNDDRIFIVSGHLDNMRTNVMDRVADAPGANDDASGVAAVMECARIMCKQSFSATILFVAMSGEEQGLLGSYFMATKARKLNWNIEGVLNNDIMGSNNSNETNLINNTQVRIFSEGLSAYELEKNAKSIRQLGLENDGKSRQLARYIKEIGERYVDNIDVKLIYRNDRFLRGGDHTPFVENGFAATRMTEMNENYTRQHQDVRKENGVQYGDLIEFIDFEYLRKNTGINLSTLANLAKAPPMPDSVKIDVKKLGNSAYLYWKKPKTGSIKGYYLLMRETTSALWQRKIFTTELSIIVPFSKDNYFFAVQSVGENGNESLPAVPSVGR
jgi:Peptidase family M28